MDASCVVRQKIGGSCKDEFVFHNLTICATQWNTVVSEAFISEMLDACSCPVHNGISCFQ